MKKTQLLLLAGLLGGCAAQQTYPPEGNISREEYQHVSGVKVKRNATKELMVVIGSAAGTASGHALAGNLAPSTVPQISQKAMYNAQQAVAQEQARAEKEAAAK